MIWIFAVVIVLFILFSFFKDASKDKDDLRNTSLKEKFNVIVNTLNSEAFNGNGSVTNLDNRSFNLYEQGKNQIIQFQYGTGHLTLTWKYKYFQKEIVHEKTYTNVRNLSLFEQKKIADDMINQMRNVVENHKINVLKDAF
jgi:Txe/YoeB family toxin of Txe-Axe toxin-antitoxin module